MSYEVHFGKEIREMGNVHVLEYLVIDGKLVYFDLAFVDRVVSNGFVLHYLWWE